jgi:hypothetical protein
MSVIDRLEFVEEIALRHRGSTCLIWPYKLNKHGYGSISQGVNAHAYVCLRANGSRPTIKHVAAHGCGVRSCVNPLHLRWATVAENNDQRYAQHNRAVGKFGAEKLSYKDALSIRVSPATGSALARQYGVSSSTISEIRSGKTYRE